MRDSVLTSIDLVFKPLSTMTYINLQLLIIFSSLTGKIKLYCTSLIDVGLICLLIRYGYSDANLPRISCQHSSYSVVMHRNLRDYDLFHFKCEVELTE